MGTLTRRVVSSLPSQPSANTATYTPSGVAYDWAIGGLPFFSANTPEHPLQRKTAPVRKDQFDATTDPGEQSLVFWWLRSQSSFHGGSGVKFQEADNTDSYSQLVKHRFQDSRGLDVFSTKGQASLLKDTSLLKSAGGTVVVHGCTDSAGPTDIVLQAEGVALYRVTAGGSSTAITWGGTGTILSVCDDGTNYYVLDNAGIWKGTLAGGAGSKIYASTATTGVIGFVKQRLVAGLGNSFYELDANSSGGAALPTAKYTHKNTAWVWTAITDTPAAILASGYAGDNSVIFKFTLDTSGIVPLLSGAVATAPLPEGELVYSLYAYLGNYVAIGSNRGVRVGTVDQTSGDVQYGPLSLTTTNPVRSMVGKDRFVYCAATNEIDGNSGLYVIDLSTQTDFRRYAYATNLQAGVSGQVNNVGLLGTSGRLVFGVNAHGSYVEHATNLVPTGWLRTGNIRFHTIENKLFKLVRVRTLPLVGSISVSQVDQGGTTTSLVTYSTAGEVSLDEVAFAAALGPQEYISVRFDLNRAADPTTGPTLTGWQVKALPAQKRQRLYIIPLLCYDHEVDKHGAHVGKEGTAVARLEALEELEEAADLVTLQDLNKDPTASRLVVIDEVAFEQKAPPGKFSGWGGYIYLTARAVT